MHKIISPQRDLRVIFGTSLELGIRGMILDFASSCKNDYPFIQEHITRYRTLLDMIARDRSFQVDFFVRDLSEENRRKSDKYTI